MIAGKRHNPCKPLASKGRSKLGPVCYVDASHQTSGPFLHEQNKISASQFALSTASCVSETATCKKPKEEQACEAAKQWSSAQYTGDGTATTKPWIKSWYYPLDAFNPWPQTTDLCCWWCSCPFDWTPFPLPYAYDRSSNRYKVIGMFCGPSCSKAYARNCGRFSFMDNIYSFIEQVATNFYGYCLNVKTGASKMCTIPEAPPKEILQKYCGPNGFTIEQYRTMCCCGRSLKVLAPHMITMKQVIEAQQEMAKTKTVFHVENPDDMQCMTTLVTKKRIPFAGLGVKRLTDYLKTKS